MSLQIDEYTGQSSIEKNQLSLQTIKITRK